MSIVMRPRNQILLALLAASSSLAVMACTNYFDEYYVPLTEIDGTGGAGGTGGTTTTTTTIEPGCIPQQSPDPVRDDCGLFVSSSKGDDAGGDGSKDKPFATIGKALKSPSRGPIYLCAETFGEAVKISAGATLYGGLDCSADWAYTSKKSVLSPQPGLVPLVLDPGVGVAIEDVALRAKDAVDAGGSSIAIIATKDAELSLERCDVEAGVAKDGATGEAFTMDAAAGMMGNAGLDACTDANVNGAASTKNACDDADPNDDSIGGRGGSSDDTSGGAGSPGTPLGTMNGGGGQLDDAGACMNGGPGDAGAAGVSGTGALGMGMISAQGYAGPAGNPGDKGKPGQGGGGGGGAKGGSGGTKCVDLMKAGGASGGSGGSGGCGGTGGKGGQAGGASIGIVSLGAVLTFKDVTITAKAAGNGGPGGAGQNGGMGGPGGAGGKKGGASGLKDGCAGGPGGSGGPGGMGGGGLGGHSLGIAHTGTAPEMAGVQITIDAAGQGGTGDGMDGSGAPGIAAKVQGF